VNRAIIDKNVTVPEGMRIGFDTVADAQRFTVSDRGIVVISKGMVL
jgi:glucose-1-phosphate adenylyltransferase